MPTAVAHDEWDLPRLKASIAFEEENRHHDDSEDPDTEFLDVKFYPYLEPQEDPIFAAVSKKHIIIYRLSNTAASPVQLIQVLRDDDENANNCSCTWSRDSETDVPWLCVAGSDAKIKVYDVIHGSLVRCIIGHGAEINDLATCPTNPSVIASASQDTTVRIWSLDAVDQKQPCLAILGGEGHSSGLLTTAFHESGRYVLSAGHDNCVCMWTLPDFSKRSLDKNPPPPPVIVHYPHFYTSEVHSGIVDCVAFYGDLILSRACHEDIIVLWRIEGFSSKNEPPSASEAPSTSDPERLTRSAFVPTTTAAIPPYVRMIQFHTPGSGHQFYMRFKLFHDKEKHPVLAFGNAHSTIFFWDLARITAFHDFMTELNKPNRETPLHRPSWLQPVVQRQRADPISKLRADAEDRDSVISGRTGSDVEPAATSNHYSQETLESWYNRYDIKRTDEALKAHSVRSISVKDFIGRQVAWSPLGDWCVVVGNRNLGVVLARWQRKEKPFGH